MLKHYVKLISMYRKNPDSNIIFISGGKFKNHKLFLEFALLKVLKSGIVPGVCISKFKNQESFLEFELINVQANHYWSLNSNAFLMGSTCKCFEIQHSCWSCAPCFNWRQKYQFNWTSSSLQLLFKIWLNSNRWPKKDQPR